MSHRLFIIDAFCTGPFSGNPAAVVPLDAWLPDEDLQAIAQENNQAETAFFVTSSNDASDSDLRWFTPTTEVDLCGHATLASAHALYAHLGFEGQTLRFQTKSKGILRVRQTGTKSYALSLPAAAQEVTQLDETLLQQLRLTALEAYKGPFLLLVLPTAEAVTTYRPDFAAIAATGYELIVTAAAGTSESFKDLDFVSRVFAPTVGIDEDPVTGSAHCQLAPYWSLVLQKTDLRAAQVGPRSGELGVSLMGSQVELTGKARTYLDGKAFF